MRKRGDGARSVLHLSVEDVAASSTIGTIGARVRRPMLGQSGSSSVRHVEGLPGT